MFCNQCEQTARGTGCTKVGVCGKQPEVAALQDLLIYALQGLSQVAVQARAKGVSDAAVNRFISEGVFSTLTNVDFDPARFQVLINEAAGYRTLLASKAGVTVNTEPPRRQRRLSGPDRLPGCLPRCRYERGCRSVWRCGRAGDRVCF